MSGLTQLDRGTPRKHIQKASSDSAAGGLTEAERTDSNGNEPVSALISVDTNNIRITLDGTTPDRSGPVGHLMEVGDFLELHTHKEVKSLDWVSATSATSGNLQITLYY